MKDQIHQHFLALSKGQKKVAQYVLENPHTVANSSAQEIGNAIGVSETTVIRFCYRIELSGFAELQKKLREQMVYQESSLHVYRQSKLEIEEESHFFQKVMEQDRTIILETMHQIKDIDYEQAVNKLSKAENVYVLGMRSSYTAANWLSFTLGLVRPNVQLIRSETEDVIQILSQMDESTVVIVISFHRYLKETLQIARLAHEQGAFIIGITDSHIAPIHEFSDLLFPIYSPNKSTLDAMSALYSFMNAIIAGLSVKEKDNFEKRQNHYKAIASDFLFVEGADKD